MTHRTYRRRTGMEPRERFEIYCKRQGWQFDNRSNHESYVNSKKLSIAEIYEPSYRVDRKFEDLATGLIWIEVKACNAKGFVKVQSKEWEIHNQLSRGRPVYYALYDQRIGGIDEAFKIVNIHEIYQSDIMKVDENNPEYLFFHMDGIQLGG